MDDKIILIGQFLEISEVTYRLCMEGSVSLAGVPVWTSARIEAWSPGQDGFPGEWVIVQDLGHAIRLVSFKVLGRKEDASTR